MSDTASTSHEDIDLNNIIRKVNRYIYNGELTEIIEITYAYKDLLNGFYYNITLFKKFGGIKYNKNSFSFEKLRDTIYDKLNSKIVHINKYIEELNLIDDSERKKILLGSLKYTKNILMITLEGVDFELEKAGYVIKLSPIEIKNKILKIGDLENKCFGKKISDNEKEMRITYSFLFKIYTENKHHLESDERVQFLNYLKLASRYLDEKYDTDVHKFKYNSFVPPEYCFYNEKISRFSYIKIYNYVMKNIYSMPQVCKVTKSGSIYDGDKLLEIPNDSSHKEITYERFMRLMSHEIECHYINSMNGKALLGNFRGSKNLEKEEGLAKTMEYFLIGYSLDNIETNPEYFPKILFSEIVEGTELYKFLGLFSKIYNSKRSYGTEFLRQKRNYSFNSTGGQHKDITYGRGMLKVIDYLKEKKDFSSLFLGKVGFDDIDKIKKLAKGNKEKITYPLFISEIIREYLICKERNKKFKFDEKEFSKYIYEKYPLKGMNKFKLKSRYKEKKTEIQGLISLLDRLL